MLLHKAVEAAAGGGPSLKLFILGSGFSKAISGLMPTVADLTQEIRRILPDLPGDPETYERLVADPERLLTYLHQTKPWATEEEGYRDRAAFIAVSRRLGSFVAECEQSAFRGATPPWGRRFVEHLHSNAYTVATLNYDTVLERLSLQPPLTSRSEDRLNLVGLEDIYQAPLTPIAHRTMATGLYIGKQPVPSYALLKLHGSVNWYYAGEGGQVASRCTMSRYRYVTMRWLAGTRWTWCR